MEAVALQERETCNCAGQVTLPQQRPLGPGGKGTSPLTQSPHGYSILPASSRQSSLGLKTLLYQRGVSFGPPDPLHSLQKALRQVKFPALSSGSRPLSTIACADAFFLPVSLKLSSLSGQLPQ